MGPVNICQLTILATNSDESLRRIYVSDKTYTGFMVAFGLPELVRYSYDIMSLVQY